MERIILTNKPLVEAIFELRWELQELEQRNIIKQDTVKVDRNYKILIGAIYERFKKVYPFHEQLPAATIPDEIAAYMVQHRFRKAEGQWPLIQLGPGIITLNDTESYVWEDFENRISELIEKLFDAYPEPDKLKIDSLQLRYIDAQALDFEKENAIKFLKENMKLKVEIYDTLFNNTGVEQKPSGLDLRFAFMSSKPKGMIHLRFARAKVKNEDALMWETNFITSKEYAPKSKDEIIKWADEAHNLTRDWFFKIIDGELLRRYK